MNMGQVSCVDDREYTRLLRIERAAKALFSVIEKEGEFRLTATTFCTAEEAGAALKQLREALKEMKK